jgi:activating signal cointegrator complex subunit 3
LLERCEHHVIATSGVFSPKELGNNILAAVQAGKNDESKLQADLFNLLGESGFDFLLQIFEHRSDLVNLKNLDMKPKQGRRSRFVRPETTTGGGVGVQVASTTDKATQKAMKRERRRLKRQGLTEAEIDDAMFGAPPEEEKSSGGGGGASGGLRRETSSTVKFQRSLPKGTKRVVHDQWEEVIVPAPSDPPPSQLTPLVPITDLPDWAQLAFRGMATLNRLQSKVYDSAFNSMKF